MSSISLIKCLKVSTVALSLLFFQTTFAQSTFEDIDAVVASKQKVLGQDVLIMVANKDTVLYQKSPKLFTGRTQAPIGDASQLLTAALIMTLVDEGKVSLDDKVVQYLPIFEKYGKTYITLRHCLTHFTGIQSEYGVKALKLFDKKKFASLEEEVAFIVSREIQSNAGTEFRYSTYGPSIAARVAEVVTKKKFDALIQQRLLRPLGMRQTTFTTTDGSLFSPANGARTTGNDFIRFLTMLLNNGTYGGTKILSETSVQELRKIAAEGNALKNAPEGAKNFQYVMGAWTEGNEGTTAKALVAPSFGGALAMVDFCRGYAFLLLPKQETNDAKANVYPQVKEILDERFRNKCK